MFFNFILSLLFHFLIVNAKLHQSEGSAIAKRGFFLKGVNPSGLVAQSASSTAPKDQAPRDSSDKPGAPTNDAANSNNSTTTGIPEPPAADTTKCTSSSGKAVNFVDRECWHAAKVMAQDGASHSQCGNCVVGLFDADKKKSFHPTGPLNATFLQEQAMNLLQHCKETGKRVTKRDSSSNSLPIDDSSSNNSTSDGPRVQLLIGYKSETKSCPGL